MKGLGAAFCAASQVYISHIRKKLLGTRKDKTNYLAKFNLRSLLEQAICRLDEFLTIPPYLYGYLLTGEHEHESNKGNTMKSTIKTLLAVGLVSALGAGGIALVANANTEPTTLTKGDRIAQTTDSEAGESSEDDINEAAENETENANEAQAMAQYQSLAKITPQQAQQAAEAAQGDTATAVELDAETGSLVYEVNFSNAEVTVDAGNGQVLKVEGEGQEENDASEAPVQGSIQVPVN